MARCVQEGRFTYLFCVGSDLWSQRPLLRLSHAPGIKRVFPDVRCCRLFAKKKDFSHCCVSRSGLNTKAAALPLCFTVSYLRKQHAKEPATFKISALQWSRGWNSNCVCVWVTPLPTLPSCSYFLGQLWQWHPVFVGLPVNHYLSLCISRQPVEVWSDHNALSERITKSPLEMLE